MKRIIIMALAILPMLTQAQELNLDTENASASFLFVSDNVDGTVAGIDATLSIDWSNLSGSSIQGTATVSTLSTGNKMRDKHLKSKDYFDAENYPKMSFKSTELQKKNGVYQAKGKLTIKKETKEVIFQMKIEEDVLVLTTTLNAADFDVSPKKEKKSTVNVTIRIPIDV